MEISHKNPRLKICLIEKESSFATHQTGHNSGVIHSGLYYKPGSLKAQNCVSGSLALKDFCDIHSIKYDLVGKVVVATTEDELPALQVLHERGVANGVEGLKMISKEELLEIEPHVNGIRALHCPKTGIIDYKEVSETYAKVSKENGVTIMMDTKLSGIREYSENLLLETTKGPIRSSYIINCAGLYSDTVAKMMDKSLETQIIPFRGEYYTISHDKDYLVKGLIYPVPNPAFPFLGVHFTRMIHGGIEAGPNAVLAFAKEGYTRKSVNIPELFSTLTYKGFWGMSYKYWKTGLQEFWRSLSKSAFTKDLQRLIPEIQEENLVSGGAGVRAQAVDVKGNLLDDFNIVQTNRAMHVINAPSPAATASLSIAQTIVSTALNQFAI
jgi:L-2-hydroxyglutarate oxidase